MSEWTIEGDDSMRWDVISDDKPVDPDFGEGDTSSEEDDSFRRKIEKQDADDAIPPTVDESIAERQRIFTELQAQNA